MDCQAAYTRPANTLVLLMFLGHIHHAWNNNVTVLPPVPEPNFVYHAAGSLDEPLDSGSAPVGNESQPGKVIGGRPINQNHSLDNSEYVNNGTNLPSSLQKTAMDINVTQSGKSTLSVNRTIIDKYLYNVGSGKNASVISGLKDILLLKPGREDIIKDTVSDSDQLQKDMPIGEMKSTSIKDQHSTQDMQNMRPVEHVEILSTSKPVTGQDGSKSLIDHVERQSLDMDDHLDPVNYQSLSSTSATSVPKDKYMGAVLQTSNPGIPVHSGNIDSTESESVTADYFPAIASSSDVNDSSVGEPDENVDEEVEDQYFIKGDDEDADWYYDIGDDDNDNEEEDEDEATNRDRFDDSEDGQNTMSWEENDENDQDDENYYEIENNDEEWTNDEDDSHPAPGSLMGRDSFDAHFGSMSEAHLMSVGQRIELHEPFIPRDSNEASLGVLVFYSWIGVVIVMVIGAFIALRHRHRIVNYVRDARISLYRREPLFATDEGRNLLLNQHV